MERDGVTRASPTSVASKSIVGEMTVLWVRRVEREDVTRASPTLRLFMTVTMTLQDVLRYVGCVQMHARGDDRAMGTHGRA